uniref:Ribosomal protein S3 n=1 Tax=Solanum lycopersicum TaxID=4081 RepID=A0A3Q7FGK7_SOLLC
YQDVNLISFFGSICLPKRLTFCFCLGCVIIHFPKSAFIHFFLPRRPQRLNRHKKSKLVDRVSSFKRRYRKRTKQSERLGVGKKVESIRLDDREKQNEIRIFPKKKQGYGYHHRSPSIKKNLSKSLHRAFKHSKYTGIENNVAFWIEIDVSFIKTNLLKFFFPKKSRYDRLTSHLLKRTLPVVHPSLNYLVMRYLLNTKKKIHFDPIIVLNNFMVPGVTEPSKMEGANAHGKA